MKLSNNFSLNEFTTSYVATRLGIDNIPGAAVIRNLTILCSKVLQPIRDHYGKSVNINSGFRCLELNRAIGSKDTSQHVVGQAADIVIKGIDNYTLAKWIRDNLEFDQLILEYWEPTNPSSGWVHVSCKEKNNRKQCLTINKAGVRPGLG